MPEHERVALDEQWIPMGGLRHTRTTVNLNTHHNPLELIARLQQRQAPAPKPAEPSAATRAVATEVMLSLRRELENGRSIEALRRELDDAIEGMRQAHVDRVCATLRPPPLTLPSDEVLSSVADGGVSVLSSCRDVPRLPRSRDKHLVRDEDKADADEKEEEEKRKKDIADADENLNPAAPLSVQPQLTYLLAPSGFAIYLDTPLRRAYAEDSEEEDDDDDEEDSEEEESEEEEEWPPPRRSILGSIDNLIEY